MPSLLLIKIELILACIQHKDHPDAIYTKIKPFNDIKLPIDKKSAEQYQTMIAETRDLLKQADQKIRIFLWIQKNESQLWQEPSDMLPTERVERNKMLLQRHALNSYEKLIMSHKIHGYLTHQAIKDFIEIDPMDKRRGDFGLQETLEASSYFSKWGHIKAQYSKSPEEYKNIINNTGFDHWLPSSDGKPDAKRISASTEVMRAQRILAILPLIYDKIDPIDLTHINFEKLTELEELAKETKNPKYSSCEKEEDENNSIF